MEKEMEPLTNGKSKNDKENGDAYNYDDMEGQDEGEGVEVKLKEKINGYVDGFTVHGLTRVFRSPRHESFFWLLVLIVGVLLAIYVFYTLITKYYSFEIYTEIRSIMTENNTMPALSICEYSLLLTAYFSYCGVLVRQGSKNKSCDLSTLPKASKDDVKFIDGKNWTNGLFDIKRCRTWNGANCLSSKYFKTHEKLQHACVTWNYDGNFFDSYGRAEIDVVFTRNLSNVKLIAIPHDHEITEIDLTKMVNLNSKKVYDITVQKTVSKRLPHPYPSACVLEEDARKLDVLPGAYSRRTCLESFQMIQGYKACGDSFDIVRDSVPEDIKKQYGHVKEGKSIWEMGECLYANVSKIKPDLKRCPFPCKELELGITSTFSESEKLSNSKNKYEYSIAIKLQNIDSYTEMEEKPLYTGDQMTCEIGGFLGLVMGASLLSFIEIVFCSSLMLIKKVYTKSKNK